MLKFLQGELPKIWTDELYSAQFKASPSRYKDFDHALKHVTKALGKLIVTTEEQDHGEPPTVASEVEKYLADLVICAVRLAITNPTGPIDLEAAVLDRIGKKMGVTLGPILPPVGLSGEAQIPAALEILHAAARESGSMEATVLLNLFGKSLAEMKA